MDIVTEKKCSKCGEIKGIHGFYRDGKRTRSECVLCKKQQDKKSRIKNLSKIKKRKRAYYIEHRQHALEKAKEWLVNHKERAQENKRRNREENRERYRESAKLRMLAWKKANPIKYKNNRDSWRKNNPYKGKEYYNLRRAREAGSGGKITAEEWRNLLEKYGHKCLCCGGSNKELALDHIVPISLGGMNLIENAQPLCKSCNSKKGTKIIDFRRP